jgi:DNA polymerase III alpha subunit
LEATAEQIIQVRKAGGKYKSFADFYFRNTFTGSKVKKQTYEALITSGAFDILYKLQGQEQRRIFLINRYRKYKKVKVSNPARDIFMNGATNQKWWWVLQQKKYTGIAFMDFKKVVLENGIETQFCSSRDLSLNQNKGVFRSFGGYVMEVKTRRSSRGAFAFITMENNYRIYKLILWSDEYQSFKKKLEGVEKSFILFDAELKFDSKWDKTNVFTLKENSDFIVLD